jgi:hypothetical protein
MLAEMDIILNSGRTIASAWAVLTYFRGNTNFGIYAKPLEERKNPSPDAAAAIRSLRQILLVMFLGVMELRRSNPIE